jgi:hypothetical protein
MTDARDLEALERRFAAGLRLRGGPGWAVRERMRLIPDTYERRTLYLDFASEAFAELARLESELIRDGWSPRAREHAGRTLLNVLDAEFSEARKGLE